MLLAALAVIIGLALLVWSADRFVDGAAASAGHFGMPQMVPTPPQCCGDRFQFSPARVVVGDFNGDGHLDFVAATTFTLVFRTFGTDQLLDSWVKLVPGGPTGAGVAPLHVTNVMLLAIIAA